jgi:hypothetical protein
MFRLQGKAGAGAGADYMQFNRDGQSILKFRRIPLFDTGTWNTSDDYVPLRLACVDYACAVSNTACGSGSHVACILECFGYIPGDHCVYTGVVCGRAESELDEPSSWHWVSDICVDACSAYWWSVGAEEVEEIKPETAAC